MNCCYTPTTSLQVFFFNINNLIWNDCCQNQGNCSPVYTCADQSLLSITFHRLYPRTCQVLKFTPCVFLVWCRLSNVEWCIVDVHLLKNRPPMQLAVEMQQLSVEVEGVRRESVYISHIVLKSPSAIIYFQTAEKTFISSFFVWVLHLFPASCLQLIQLFSCLCFRVCVFFSSYFCLKWRHFFGAFV